MMAEVATIVETQSATSFSSSTVLGIPEDEAKLSCIFNEEVHHIPTPPTGSVEGIHANDIGSLLEQFLEYEQGSEGDASSRQDSYYITPVGSPGGPNDDVVLGRLMIVQEKLTHEVETNALASECESNTPSPPPGDDEDGQNTIVDNNNVSSSKLRVDGLLRTVNGVHPKGSNIRMADSPKFARFKKKKLTSEPLRRCNSGTTTPRSISPGNIDAEELKRREALLIQTLQLSNPKDDNKSKAVSDKTDVIKVKRNLNSKVKRKATEPVPSRLMSVISKRQKSLEQIKKLPGNSLDPRLVKYGYCEQSNTTYLKNTNLDQISGSTVYEEEDDTTVDHVGIVDMTIDHEALSGTIITTNKTIELHTSLPENSESVEESNEKNSMIQQLEQLDSKPILSQHEIKQEPIDYVQTEIVNEPAVEHESKPSQPVLEQGSVFKSKPQRSIQLVRPHSMKPPKNYRQTNNMKQSSSSGSGSESDFDYDAKRSRRKTPIKKRLQRPKGSSRRRSKSPSRARSRSPLSRRSPGSPIPRSQLYDTNRCYEGRTRKPNSRLSSTQNSDEENIDISNKLSELSNPVPYDIEHERKLQFLVGKNNEKYTERRNIYVGGINKFTTKHDLIERFRRFGKIEKTTLHFREKGDNYAFIVFEHPDCAMRAIEEGNDDPAYPRLELCFGGRRKFVGGSYVDFDGNNSYLEESERNNRNIRCESPEDDFDSLLRRAAQDIKKRELTPEWD